MNEDMVEQIICRLPKDIRIELASILTHKKQEFVKKLEKKILNYLNRLAERKKIPEAFKARFDKEHQELENQKALITSNTELLQGLTNQSGNAIVNAAGIITGVAGTVAQRYQDHRLNSLSAHEAAEELQAAQMNMYVAEHRAPIAKLASQAIAEHHCLQILRLNNGNSGYIGFADFFGDVIQAMAIDKVRGEANQVDAIIDAAIPKSSSHHYLTPYPTTAKHLLLQVLEIDIHVNELIYQCGPAVESILGKYKKSPYYTIKGLLNHAFMVDAQLKIYSGATLSKKNTSYRLNSENPYPIQLVWPNETTVNIGLEHGTAILNYPLLPQQREVLLRLVPGFLKNDIERDINNVPKDVITDDPAKMVHIEEKSEFGWSEERRDEWQKRKNIIDEAVKHVKYNSPNYGIVCKQTANLYDASLAANDVRKMISVCEQAFNELIVLDGSDFYRNKSTEKKRLKANLIEENYFLVISAEKLLSACKEINISAPEREEYIQLVILALKKSKHNIEATRETPILEHAALDEIAQKTHQTKATFKRWQQHLFACLDTLDIVKETAEPLQQTPEIRRFVVNMNYEKRKKIETHMLEGARYLAHTNMLFKQMETLIKFASYDAKLRDFVEKKENHPLMLVNREPSFYIKQNRQPCTSPSMLNRSLSVGDLAEYEQRSQQHRTQHQESLSEVGIQDIEHINLASALYTHDGNEPENIDDNNLPVDTQSDHSTESANYHWHEAISNAFRDFKPSYKVSKIEEQIAKIDLCTNGINQFANGIWASLKVDRLAENHFYRNDRVVRLKESDHEVAIMAYKIKIAANINKALARSHKAKAEQFFALSRRRTIARKTIKDCERKSIQQIFDILEKQNVLYQRYIEQQRQKYKLPTTQILWTYERFERTVSHEIRCKPNEEEEIKDIVETTKKTIQIYENKLDEENFCDMKHYNDTMIEQANSLSGEKPNTITEALRYAQIMKNCNRKMIHAANGERTAIASSKTLSKQLEDDIDEAKNNIEKVHSILRGLARDCQNSSYFNTTFKKNSVIVDVSTIKEEVDTFISQLIRKSTSIATAKTLSRNDSIIRKNHETEALREHLYGKIQDLLTLICSDDADKKSILADKIAQDLKEYIKSLPESNYYINWAMWIMTIAAQSCILFNKSELGLAGYPKTSFQAFPTKPENEPDLTSQVMIDTRKRMLLIYQRLEHTMHHISHKKNETLKTDKEIVRDEIERSSQLNIDEEKEKGLEKKEDMEKLGGQTGIETVDTYLNLLNTSVAMKKPQKTIYYQLLIYSIYYIRNKQHIIHQLNGFRKALINDYQFFENIQHYTQKYVSITNDIKALHEKISHKVKTEQKQKSHIVALEKNLTSELILKRVFFQEWKNNIPETHDTKSNLASLKEASEARALAKKRQQDKSKIETSETAEDVHEDTEDDFLQHHNIDYLTLDNIKTRYNQLQQRIIKIKNTIDVSNLHELETKEDSDTSSQLSFLSSSDKSSSAFFLSPKPPRKNEEKASNKQNFFQPPPSKKVKKRSKQKSSNQVQSAPSQIRSSN